MHLSTLFFKIKKYGRYDWHISSTTGKINDSRVAYVTLSDTLINGLKCIRGSFTGLSISAISDNLEFIWDTVILNYAEAKNLYMFQNFQSDFLANIWPRHWPKCRDFWPQSTSRNQKHFSQHSYILVKNPYILVKNPYILVKNLYILVKNPYVLVKIPTFWSKIPTFWSKIPTFWSKIPTFWSKIPTFWSKILAKNSYLVQEITLKILEHIQVFGFCIVK